MKDLVEFALKYMEERFGIHRDVFCGYSFIVRGNKIRIVAREVANKDLSGLKVENIGILFGRYFKKENKFKPTTNALQIFGKYATKNIVELSEEEKEDYIRGFDLKKDLNIEEGYVILKYKGDVLGCGLYRDGKIKNQVPKARVLPPSDS
ncbi:MAG: methyltransferase RsmF C-terminal domain-like protein [Candidatus Methanospirareceae archaeon]